jgi:hypothetical protein
MGGDDVVVTKAGKPTYGVDRFFPSLSGQGVPGRGLLRVSLLSVKRRPSSPVMREPLEQPPTDPPPELSITHNFCELRERLKG